MERRIEDVQYCERLFQSFYDIGSTSQGGVTRLAVPWPPDTPLPLTELFCFASVGRREGKRYVFFVFSGGWTPVMPGKP